MWSRVRFNLYKLFLPKNGDEKRRSLVVDLAAPRFGRWSGKIAQSCEKIAEEDAIVPQEPEAEHRTSESLNLNEEQEAFINKLLAAKDYLLLHGMPGTGKVKSTIACLLLAGSLDPLADDDNVVCCPRACEERQTSSPHCVHS